MTPCIKVSTGSRFNLTCESANPGVETYTFYKQIYKQVAVQIGVPQRENIYEVKDVTALTFYYCTVKIHGNTRSSNKSNVQPVTFLNSKYA